MAKTKAKVADNDFALVSEFRGYRHKEDKTNMPPGYLVEGSQNVLVNTSSRVSIRKGYTLDGQAQGSLLDNPPTSFDWTTSFGFERNVRSGGSNLQYRKVTTTLAGAEVVSWADLMTGLTDLAFNYTTFFLTNTEAINAMLFVNGSSNIYEWSGGLADFASATVNTITKEGSTTWAQEGFYVTTAGRAVVIDGITYTYTGGETTLTLTGVTPDPTAGGHIAGDFIHQAVRTRTNASMGVIPSTFKNGLIEVLNNQIYVGALSGSNSNNIYVSAVNDYEDFSFTSPVRIVGEGAKLTLKGTPTAFVTQENAMYICVVPDQWYQTVFTLSSDNTAESLVVNPLKTAPQQAALSQACVAKIKNSVILVTREPTLDELGRVVNNFATPQQTNYSDPIKLDFDEYDFTDASLIYWRDSIYIAVPQEGLVLVYNLSEQWWESPLTLPVARFSIINAELYGHDYSVQQTYKLFDGYNDNGNPIDARAIFSFQNYGTRSRLKCFNEFFSEGYIAGNTTITLGIQYDIDGCATQTSYDLVGSNRQFVCVTAAGGSLGKVSLGKNPLGAGVASSSASSLPPKFRWDRTFPPKNFYETQVSYSSIGLDYQWELLAFGPKVRLSADTGVAIKD